MALYKNPMIKTADLEAALNEMEKNIRENPYPTQNAILELVKALHKRVITYEPREEISIPHFLEVR